MPLASFVLLAFLAAIPTGYVEHGRVDELRGMKSFYIDVDDFEFHEQFRQNVESELAGVTIADKAESADAVIGVEIKRLRNGHAATIVVWRWADDGKTPRLLFQSHDAKTSRLTMKLSTVLARRFVAAYRDANR